MKIETHFLTLLIIPTFQSMKVKKNEKKKLQHQKSDTLNYGISIDCIIQ